MMSSQTSHTLHCTVRPGTMDLGRIPGLYKCHFNVMTCEGTVVLNLFNEAKVVFQGCVVVYFQKKYNLNLDSC